MENDMTEPDRIAWWELKTPSAAFVRVILWHPHVRVRRVVRSPLSWSPYLNMKSLYGPALLPGIPYIHVSDTFKVPLHFYKQHVGKARCFFPLRQKSFSAWCKHGLPACATGDDLHAGIIPKWDEPDKCWLARPLEIHARVCRKQERLKQRTGNEGSDTRPEWDEIDKGSRKKEIQEEKMEMKQIRCVWKGRGR